MFSPRQYVIALTNNGDLEKYFGKTLFNPNEDYFLHVDTQSGSYYPATDFFGIKLFVSIEDAKNAIKYCYNFHPIICEINCTPVGL